MFIQNALVILATPWDYSAPSVCARSCRIYWRGGLMAFKKRNERGEAEEKVKSSSSKTMMADFEPVAAPPARGRSKAPPKTNA